MKKFEFRKMSNFRRI